MFIYFTINDIIKDYEEYCDLYFSRSNPSSSANSQSFEAVYISRHGSASQIRLSRRLRSISSAIRRKTTYDGEL